MDSIRAAITSVAKYYGTDPRVLLGIMMEESHGGVGVVTTYDAEGVPTGGLMQASNCQGYDGKNNLAQVMRTSPHTPNPRVPQHDHDQHQVRLTDRQTG